MTKSKKLHAVGVLAAVAILGAAAFATAPAFAAKGGGGGGGRGGHQTQPPATGTCSVNPNPLAAYEVGTLSGSGFAANVTVGITIKSASGDVAAGFATTDGYGRFSTAVQGWTGTNAVAVSSGGASANCTFVVN